MRARKRRLWEEFGQVITDRKDFEEFVIEYHKLFNPLWTREKALNERVGVLKKRVQHAHEMSEAAESIEDPAPRVPLPEENEDDPEEDSLPDVLLAPTAAADTTETPAPQTPPITPQDEARTSDAKKEIGTMFRKIYDAHAQGGTHEVSKQVGGIENNKSLDEMDLILSLPFDEQHEALWGENVLNKESPATRYYRYALWDHVLKEAEHEKVPILRTTLNNKLYPLYRERAEASKGMARGTWPTVAMYFQEQVELIEARIQQLEAQVKDLQARLGG